MTNKPENKERISGECINHKRLLIDGVCDYCEHIKKPCRKGCKKCIEIGIFCKHGVPQVICGEVHENEQQEYARQEYSRGREDLLKELDLTKIAYYKEKPKEAIKKDFKEKDSDVVSRFWEVHNSHKLSNDKWTIEQSIEVILPLVYEEGYKYGYGKERWLREETIKTARKELKEELSGKIKKASNKLYCTEEHLGYHDKNCDGACEKYAYKEILKLIQGL